MIGILVVAHRPLGSALVEAARHVYGEVERLAVLDIIPDATTGLALARAEQLLEDVDTGGGVLVLTDIFGATPSNLVAALAGPHVRILAGVNLPMLLRAISYRHEPLSVVEEKAAAGGALGIVHVGSKAPQNQAVVPDAANRESLRAFQAKQQQQ